MIGTLVNVLLWLDLHRDRQWRTLPRTHNHEQSLTTSTQNDASGAFKTKLFCGEGGGVGDREKRVGREFTRGGLGGRKRRGDLRRGGFGGVGFTTKNYKYGCGANYMRIS